MKKPSVHSFLRKLFSATTQSGNQYMKAEQSENSDSVVIKLPHAILGEDILLRNGSDLFEISYKERKNYIFDLEDTIYIDSIGLGYLTMQIKMAKQANCGIKFININKRVEESLNLLGIKSFYN